MFYLFLDCVQLNWLIGSESNEKSLPFEWELSIKSGLISSAENAKELDTLVFSQWLKCGH